MPNPELDPPSAASPAPAVPTAQAVPTAPSTPAAGSRRPIVLIIAAVVLIMALCCVCLLAAGFIWVMRQGNPPLFEDMLQVFAPGFAWVVG